MSFMRSSKRKTTLVWFLILIALPWPIDYWRTAAQQRQDERDDELYARYDCYPFSECVADFNGDGTPARFDVVPCGSLFYGCLSVSESGSEILRLPYNSTDGTFRTHAAVSSDSGNARLLIYDGGSQRPALRAVFAWDGDRLFRTEPTGFEREIINAMAAHDDTGGWNERAFRDFFRPQFRFVIYYLLLTVFAGVVFLWGNVSSLRGSPPHNRDYHFLRGCQ